LKQRIALSRFRVSLLFAEKLAHAWRVAANEDGAISMHSRRSSHAKALRNTARILPNAPIVNKHMGVSSAGYVDKNANAVAPARAQGRRYDGTDGSEALPRF
jgi:hypothetical protein